MRRWGIIVTAYYVIILSVLVAPGASFLMSGSDAEDLYSIYDELLPHLFSFDGILDWGGLAWLVVIVVATSQALLLFLTVDTSYARLQPRRRIALSVTTVTFAAGALTLAALWSIGVALFADEAFDLPWMSIGAPLLSWGVWGVVFYMYRERISRRLDRAVNGLLGGSVLLLLIAVPCHVIVRNRNDCCAPGVTAYGIATGIAIMLMAFGPSVLFLYQRRLREYGLEKTKQPGRPRRIVSVTLGALAATAVVLALLSPVDDDWELRLSVSELQSPAAAAALVGSAESLGMTTRQQDETAILLLCDGDLIGRVQVPEARDGAQRWLVFLRADQAELIAALTSTLEGYATGLLLTLAPATVNEWRARISHGNLLGRVCDSQ